MRFLIDHLPIDEQMKIRSENAKEMREFIKENPIMSGTIMNGVKYESIDENEPSL